MEGTKPPVKTVLQEHLDAVFSSSTQAYREVLLGCAVARILDKSIDIHLPYVAHGPTAFNARDLDEKVINPFLQAKRVPCTKGPYLSTFRRQVRFHPATRDGLRDKTGFDSLLILIDHLAATSDDSDLAAFLLHVLFRFAQLREASIVPLTRLQRLSLEQYGMLFSSLLQTPSGGLYPVLLVVCMFKTIAHSFGLGWNVQWQGINVADAPSGAGGDITVRDGDRLVVAVEVTERQVDEARVVATFNTKIAPAGIQDYLFLVGATEPTEEAKSRARVYFAQGHEINFVQVCDWLLMLLATLGKTGRDLFNTNLMELLDAPDTPQTVRAAWNECTASLFELSS